MIDCVLFFKLIKFCVVGFSGMFVDFGATWLLKEKARINKYLANSTGFVLAATSNYFLNRIWTFHSHNQQIATEYFSFITISLIGLGINNLIIYLLTEKFKLNFYLSKLFAIGIVTIWNFVMNYLITFK
ncbi:MAG: GtrA family protein [Bacteroidales bacterium]|nr:GtrA family protein [Bacteroidales bacterium]